MAPWEQHIAETCRRLTELNRERGVDYQVWFCIKIDGWHGFVAPGVYADGHDWATTEADAEAKAQVLADKSHLMAPWFEGTQVVLGGGCP